MKGSDASWKEDKEVPIAELDFSDDEEESKTRKKVWKVDRLLDMIL